MKSFSLIMIYVKHVLILIHMERQWLTDGLTQEIMACQVTQAGVTTGESGRVFRRSSAAV